MKELSKEPVRDRAEHNAYFPSDLFIECLYKSKDRF